MMKGEAKKNFNLEAYRMKESRVFRDPVHGYFRMYYLPFWHIVNTKEMQRLRRIHQLGGTFMVYQSAEHSRFTHSLGVYEIVRRILELETFEGFVDDYDRLTVLMAALLHDIGHGPYSHSFENVSSTHHEDYTLKIILDEKTEVHQVLSQIDEELPFDVASVISKTHPNTLLIQIISSQIDGDRMDYLLRDSYFSGTTYGVFDLERILRTMRVHNGQIVIKETGIQAVENYILARYHMYWQVYYHPVIRSYEQLLMTIFERLNYLYRIDFDFGCNLRYLLPFLEGKEVDVASYIALDEHILTYYFRCLTECQDKILSDLCERFLNRKLFKHQDLKSNEDFIAIQDLVKSQGFDPKYYVLTDDASTTPYKHYDAGHEVEEIRILMADGTVKVLPEVSEIVRAIVQDGRNKKDRKIYYPKEVSQVAMLKQGHQA